MVKIDRGLSGLKDEIMKEKCMIVIKRYPGIENLLGLMRIFIHVLMLSRYSKILCKTEYRYWGSFQGNKPVAQ